MKHWNLLSLAPSTDKREPRQPGPDAPRVPTAGRPKPRVLFSHPECRAVVVELAAGEEMGDHRVRERAVVHVVQGRVTVDSGAESVEAAAGTVVVFEPGEPHSLLAHEDAQLLLLLAPWAAADQQRLPPNAVVPPDAA